MTTFLGGGPPGHSHLIWPADIAEERGERLGTAGVRGWAGVLRALYERGREFGGHLGNFWGGAAFGCMAAAWRRVWEGLAGRFARGMEGDWRGIGGREVGV